MVLLCRNRLATPIEQRDEPESERYDSNRGSIECAALVAPIDTDRRAAVERWTDDASLSHAVRFARGNVVLLDASRLVSAGWRRGESLSGQYDRNPCGHNRATPFAREHSNLWATVNGWAHHAGFADTIRLSWR